MDWGRYANPTRLPNSHTMRDVRGLRETADRLDQAVRHSRMRGGDREVINAALNTLESQIKRLEKTADRGRAANPAEYFVWERGAGGRLTQIGGPLSLKSAKTFARIGATEGKHDRIVTRGQRGRLVIRKYEAGTGERLV